MKRQQNRTLLDQMIQCLESAELTKALWLVCLLLGFILFSQIAAAGTVSTSGTWGSLYTLINNWFTGDPGIIISLVGFGAGLLGAITSSHKTPFIIGAIAIPIAVQVGPSIVQSLSGAVL